jgi:hypothetical protein
MSAAKRSWMVATRYKSPTSIDDYLDDTIPTMDEVDDMRARAADDAYEYARDMEINS